MQSAEVVLNAIRKCGAPVTGTSITEDPLEHHSRRTLESRMMQKCQVRFGRGSMEKYPDEGQLASGLPYGAGQQVISTLTSRAVQT